MASGNMRYWMPAPLLWHRRPCLHGPSVSLTIHLVLFFSASTHTVEPSHSVRCRSPLMSMDDFRPKLQVFHGDEPTEDGGLWLRCVYGSVPSHQNKKSHRDNSAELIQDSSPGSWKTEKRNVFHENDSGLKPTMEAEAFLTSAAAGSSWSHSIIAGLSSWVKRALFKRAASSNKSQRQDATEPVNGVIFQKCASVENQGDLQIASITLLTHSTDVSSPPANISNLVLQDNTTGLVVRDVTSNSGNSSDGTQTYHKEFLKAGDFFLVNYTASLNMKNVKDGLKLSLPAHLTFLNSSQVPASVSYVANFIITAKQNVKVLPDHGMHGVGFVVAFVASFLVTSCVLLILYYTKRLKWKFLGNFQKINGEQRLDESQINARDNVNEDFIAMDMMIDFLAFEEPENMLQALDDAEIANLTHVDSYLEACRMRIYKDSTEILLRNMASTSTLSSQGEKRLNNVLSEHWMNLENRIQEERQRKMVALTAECNLDTRKQMDMQYRKQKAASDEAEDLMKHVGEKVLTDYRLALDKLHGLEQAEMKRLLLCKQEEEFAKAYRQLSVSHRSELHGVFFGQMQDSLSKGKIKSDVQRALIENYLKIQEEEEDLFDFMQAYKKYLTSKRLAVRKNLLYNVQLCDSRSRCLLNTAATQIASLLNKTERAGHISESQAELLLQKAQTEVLKVKQKLENALKNEKRKLHQKLSAKRKRHVIQKLKEQKKEQMTIQEVSRTTSEVKHYLEHWKKLFSDQSLELEEIFEQHDNEAIEELKSLETNLAEKAIEDLHHIQNAVIMQEMSKLNVPRLHLQQVLEEHKRESALLAQQLDKEECDKANDARTSLESTKRKLEDEFKLTMKEQRNLRHWEHLLFKILLLPLCLSKEDIHRIRQEFQCGFSQMDITLALPKIQGRRLLQTYLAEWRREQLQKLDQRLVEMEKESYSRKKDAQEKTIEALKKSVEDKILIYEAQISDDKIKQARAELLLQRVHRLKAREYKLGEYITSMQSQRTNSKWKALEIHTALLHLQSLLLEETCRSQIGDKSEYELLLEAQSREIRKIDQNLETWIQKDVVADKQPEADNISISADAVPDESDDLPLSAALRVALNRRKHVTNLYRDRMQREEMEYAVLEDQEEKIQMDAILQLYNQNIRLTAYLTKRAKLPEGMLHRVLNLLLPSSMENEILSVLYSVGHKYSGNVTETDNSEDGADSRGRSKHHELWTVIEKRLKEELVTSEQETNVFTGRKKGSILKKKRLRPVKRVSFSHAENFSKLLQSYGHSEGFGSAERIDLPDTGEKLFIFTAPSGSPTSSTKPKKKRNFLNSKKANTSHV
ncbi:limbin isoform X2 [Spea bombifrons]|uniref:limbin isoform X2 n=1 Tax=Spea bombifrons TaxID=233779 RepID=UPI00234A2159|nr:limbin isoform X2 [Spea bombifrons]